MNRMYFHHPKLPTIQPMLTSKKLMPAFVIITSLFFMWGLAHNLNPILIPHLKKACRLTDLQSAFIDSAFFIGYFVMALPAGFAMKKWGYKSGIIMGLLLFANSKWFNFPGNGCQSLYHRFRVGGNGHTTAQLFAIVQWPCGNPRSVSGWYFYPFGKKHQR